MLTDVRQAFAGRGTLSYRQGAGVVGTAGVLFSFTALLFRGATHSGEWQFLFMRGASMAAVLLFVVYLRRRSRPVSRVDLSWRVLAAGALLASMSTLFIVALARATAALVTFLLAAAPFSGAFFGRLMLGEPVSRPTVLAALAALGGVGLMVGAGIEAGAAAGVLLAAAIPLMLGLYNVLIRGAGGAIDPIVPPIVSGILLTVAAGSVAVAGSGLAVGWRDAVLGVLAGGVSLGVGLPLFNLGHRSVPAAQVSLLNLTEIVLAPIWVWIWPGEVPSPATLIGGGVVLAAVIFLVVASDRALRIPSP